MEHTHVGPGLVSTSPAWGMVVDVRCFLVMMAGEIGVVPDSKMTCRLTAGAERRPAEKTAILGSPCGEQGEVVPV